MSLELVTDVDAVWSDVSKYIDSVVPYVHEDFTTQDIKEGLASKTYNLIVFKDEEKLIGVIVFMSQTIAKKKSAFILIASGKNITTDLHWSELVTLFKKLGYKYVEAAMRDSTLRLWSSLGFKKKYNIAGVNI
jgi:hypothetical protein